MNDVALQAVLAGIVGAVVGSFLATLAIRWPAGRSIARGRSACDGCGLVLAPGRLVPLVSYAGTRGRCSACGAAIDWRHPAMEVACAAIGGIALWIAPGPAGWLGALFGWALGVLALLDADHFWLPDVLTLPLLAGGLVVGVPPFGARLIGAAAGWAVLALLAYLYRRARGRIGLGQGDAKLLGAIGAWLGWAVLPWVVLGACAIGIAWALVRGMRRDDRLPFGALLAGAAWAGWVLLQLY
ncbi:leader peptidase (prepilin peptidase)/N-methyltransferase [Sphingomonas vulcanisoli]|uniref:Prepilin leader peptidase/N-methyltransferase n=1 Tax=Sphingomonas vulcanisoli TaxID=1658060 RepID=A0ABX0TMA7_9SPHN|nr:A24 family peptidase [Sphingomonas vulcanisoli]NIJ06653.1 leader peptidase (prepilin peptidase)/N-methyltransferase [Sphingomonas vulcanisoli]